MNFNLTTKINKESLAFKDIEYYLISPVAGLDESLEVKEDEVFVDIDSFNHLDYLREYNQRKSYLLAEVIKSLKVLKEKLSDESESDENYFIFNLFEEVQKDQQSYDLYDSFIKVLKERYAESKKETGLQKIYLLINNKFFIEYVKTENLFELACVYSSFIENEKDLLNVFLGKQAARKIELFFNEIPRALVVFNENRELFFHNKSFRNLNILSKDVLKLSDGIIEFSGNSYNLSKFDLSLNYQLYVFDKTLNVENNYDEELGIITGSIAHELNNPIAGILSGVEAIIALSDSLDQDSKEMFLEVKKSGLKSKDLINTFLGFYRSNFASSEKYEIKRSIEQAYDFIRTRLIESDLKFKMNIEGDFNFFTEEKALWTMIFYIIFTNCINLILRDQLIRRKKVNSFTLNLTFFKDRVKISLIELSFIQQLYSEINQSPFFHYLLSRDSMELHFTDNQIEILRK